jgi:hypothetical protein
MSIQSFLIDACILRDYIAEFAAHFIYVSQTGEPIAKVTTMASLKKNILDKTATDPLSISLSEAVDAGGWLNELGGIGISLCTRLRSHRQDKGFLRSKIFFFLI